MVFVDSLGIVYTSIETRSIILRYPYDSLDSEEDVCDEPKDAVWGGEVGASVGKFVVFDYYEGGEERQNGGAIYGGVYVRTDSFLLRGMRRLEDENGLCGQKQASGVE